MKHDTYEIQYDVQLAANVIEARMKRGMTQAQLAKRLGTKQPAVARLEAGNVPPSHRMLKKLARIFKAKLLPPSFDL